MRTVDLRGTGNQLVPQLCQPGDPAGNIFCGFLYRGRQAYDACGIFRAGPAASLLGAAVDQVLKADAPADIQGAAAFGAMNFMAGKGHQVNALGFYVDGHVAYRLNRVGMEQNLVLFAHRRQFGNGLNSTDFVVSVHNSHQSGVIPNRRFQLLGTDDAVAVDLQQGDFKAFLF